MGMQNLRVVHPSRSTVAVIKLTYAHRERAEICQIGKGVDGYGPAQFLGFG
jgi:hypothetical protein